MPSPKLAGLRSLEWGLFGAVGLFLGFDFVERIRFALGRRLRASRNVVELFGGGDRFRLVLFGDPPHGGEWGINRASCDQAGAQQHGGSHPAERIHRERPSLASWIESRV